MEGPKVTVRSRPSFGLASLCASLILVPTTLGADVRAAERAAQSELLEHINAARREYGRRPLRYSAVLARPARTQSAFLARTGLLQHADAHGRPFHVRLYLAGYPRSRAVGEDIGIVAGCDTAASTDVIDMWLESPPHRRVLLSEAFVTVGIGVVAYGGCRHTAYTADFGG
jgi:uncharacterized protein YkwD